MIGVNIYGLIQNIQENMSGTIRTIAEIGFDEVELLVSPRKEQGEIPAAIASEETIPLLIAETRKNGLQVRSAHVLDGFLIPPEKLACYLEKLYRLYGIEAFVFSGLFKDAEGAKKWACFLRMLSEMLDAEGVQILYHNHSQEFETIQVENQEMTALDYFFSLAGEKVGMQLDIGWAGIGADELEIARKYASQIISLHLKDFTAGTKGNFRNENMPRERFCAIGNGEIRSAELLAIRHAFPKFNGSIIIDQDHSTTDILEDIRAGYQNINTML